MASEALYIVDGFGERRFIGYVWGQTLHMERKKSIHFFRKFQSWALDEDVYNQNPGVLVFVLTDKEIILSTWHHAGTLTYTLSVLSSMVICLSLRCH